MTTTSVCPCCALPAERVLFRNDAAVAVLDAHPVTLGHTLVIPRRHVASFFDATPLEREAMPALLDMAKQQLQAEFGPAGLQHRHQRWRGGGADHRPPARALDPPVSQ